MKPKIAFVAALAALILPAGALAANAASTASNATSAAPASLDWQIPLKPGSAYPNARGSAQYQAQPGQREFQAEVEHIASLAGKKVSFRVNGSLIGTRTVSSLGKAEISRNTEFGQAVPHITHGSLVTVRNSAGRLIASGRF